MGRCQTGRGASNDRSKVAPLVTADVWAGEENESGIPSGSPFLTPRAPPNADITQATYYKHIWRPILGPTSSRLGSDSVNSDAVPTRFRRGFDALPTRFRRASDTLPTRANRSVERQDRL